ncbi:hypothetical protein [Sphingomonas jaspsi]|uniref:hypothetical protein n=1 Tax=Sphingomonas jaspsi TaxID=392409 RepID=UPI0004ACF94E|nr:hypothetical protein [Sphingomonas jaspsi]
MFWLFHNDKPWFAPKRFGLGAGLPIAWQGWVLLAAHIALIAGVAALFEDRPGVLVPLVLVAALLPLPLYAAKTKGGWHWRWGSGE